MYLKAKDLPLVLVFDTLEHFRCFSGHGRARPPRDDRRHRAPVDALDEHRRDQEGWIRRVFRRPHGGRIPNGGFGLSVGRRIHGREGRRDHRPFRGHGSRWYDCARTTWQKNLENTGFFVVRVFSCYVCKRTTHLNYR